MLHPLSAGMPLELILLSLPESLCDKTSVKPPSVYASEVTCKPLIVQVNPFHLWMRPPHSFTPSAFFLPDDVVNESPV